MFTLQHRSLIKMNVLLYPHLLIFIYGKMILGSDVYLGSALLFESPNESRCCLAAVKLCRVVFGNKSASRWKHAIQERWENQKYNQN